MAALPTTNITTTLVANTLDVVTRNVGELCTSSKINMWSKRKPTRDDRITVPLADVGKGTGSNFSDYGYDYGIKLPLPYDGTDTQLCTYLKPTSSHPKRLGDFRGYEHKAVLPINIPPQPKKIDKNQPLTIIPMVASNSNSVSISDLFGTPEIYFGVEVFEGSTSKGWGSGNILGGVTIPFPDIKFTSTEVDIKFFLTNIIKEFSAGGPGHEKYPIPREYKSENKFWTNVTLVAVEKPKLIELGVFPEPDNERVRFKITHNDYTQYGTFTLFVRRESDNQQVYVDDVDIFQEETTVYVEDRYFTQNVRYIAAVSRKGGGVVAEKGFMLLMLNT